MKNCPKHRLMFKQRTFYVILTWIFLIGIFSNACAGGYPGFKEVKDGEFRTLADKDIQKLPPSWHPYKGYIKAYGLKKGKSGKEKVSIISIWSHDYLDAQHKDTWEDFPQPIMVDEQFNLLGTFPELYPQSYVNSLYAYYGKWKDGIPTEILIDVSDPTVSGDYYYAPLVWDTKQRKYVMQDKEPQYGQRPAK